MLISAVITLFYIRTFVTSVELKPGTPIPHAEVLDELLAKFLGDSYTNNALFDFILGEQRNNTNLTTENLDIKTLDVDNVRKIINFAKNKHEQKLIAESRRSAPNFRRQQAYYWQHEINVKALHLMKHEIYLTKERISITEPWRKKYKIHHSYQIATLYGAATAILSKMESLLSQMKMFYWRTHFLWWLILYEKILACNIDISNLVERIFFIQKTFAKGRGPKPNKKIDLASQKGKPGVPQGALEFALMKQQAEKQRKEAEKGK